MASKEISAFGFVSVTKDMTGGSSPLISSSNDAGVRPGRACGQFSGCCLFFFLPSARLSEAETEPTHRMLVMSYTFMFCPVAFRGWLFHYQGTGK